jgi:serine/threonine-protein kinase
LSDDGYYLPPPRSPVPAAVITSIVTTVALFFGLRALDERGAFPSLSKAPPAGAVEVPSLLGMQPEQARELLKGRDLLLAFSVERDSAKYPAGTVAEQAPLPGSQASRGTTVQAVISRGVTQVPIPKVAGLKPADAVKQLAAVGLGVGTERTVPSDSAPPGTVVETEPAAGTPLAPRATVALIVSAGPAAKPVPKLAGLRLRAARELLQQQGLQAGKVRYVADDDRPEGVVLQQKPAPPETAAPGTAVDLWVNEE